MFFGLFKKKESAQSQVKSVVVVNPTQYHPKIVLAWSKAVEGNKTILEWLAKNGYEELAVACWAIRLESDARNWLMKNGHPHLMAFINAAEGNSSAQRWLVRHNLMQYAYMAKAIDGDIEAYHWLLKNSSPDVFILTKAIERVKDNIEEKHRDVHHFGD